MNNIETLAADVSAGIRKHQTPAKRHKTVDRRASAEAVQKPASHYGQPPGQISVRGWKPGAGLEHLEHVKYLAAQTDQLDLSSTGVFALTEDERKLVSGYHAEAQEAQNTMSTYNPTSVESRWRTEKNLLIDPKRRLSPEELAEWEADLKQRKDEGREKFTVARTKLEQLRDEYRVCCLGILKRFLPAAENLLEQIRVEDRERAAKVGLKIRMVGEVEWAVYWKVDNLKSDIAGELKAFGHDSPWGYLKGYAKP